MNIRKKIRHLNFNKKMQLFVASSIILVALFIFLATTLYLLASTTDKSKKLAYEQIALVEDNVRKEFNNLTSISYGINLNESLQTYLKSEWLSLDKDYERISSVKNHFRSYLNMNPNVNFIAVIDNEFEDSIYAGTSNLNESGFNEMVMQDFDNSIKTGRGSQRINLNSIYFTSDDKTITLYQPLYSAFVINRKLGTLCINIDKGIILSESTITGFEFSTYIVDMKGNIKLSNDVEMNPKNLNFSQLNITSSGTYEQNSNLYIVEKIRNHDFYIVGKIPMVEFYSDTLYIALAIAALVIVFVLFSVLIVSKLIDKSYVPMKNVVMGMEKFIAGDMNTQLPKEDIGDDFLRLTDGFNNMINRINYLLETVKLEHKQKEQLRFNALQSKIKPHFLYNTLDSIHWQVAADGNKEASKLVKSLASYYRICLSKGEDIIPLAKEFEQVERYMEIQNIRYNHIINFEEKLSPELYNQIIPKMTIQPLVENAIYHGIRVKEGRIGNIWIEAKTLGKEVLILVKDNGIGTDDKGLKKINQALENDGVEYGYGIQNVNKRIKLMYGENYGLTYHINELGGMTVEIHLPIRAIDENRKRGQHV